MTFGSDTEHREGTVSRTHKTDAKTLVPCADSLRALCSQLADLELKSAGAPLVSIAKGDAPAAADWQHESSSSSSGAGKGEDWELL